MQLLYPSDPFDAKRPDDVFAEEVAAVRTCAAPMVWMGRAFAAPPSRNSAQWRKLEALVQAGFHFGRYRGYIAPSPPDRLTDVKRFLFENPKHPLKRPGI